VENREEIYSIVCVCVWQTENNNNECAIILHFIKLRGLSFCPFAIRCRRHFLCEH